MQPPPKFVLQQDDAIQVDAIPGGSTWSEGLESAESSTQLEGAEGAEARKKKRSRVVLSCTMCVKRKSKCDKVVPCSGCVRRGDPAGCVVEGLDEVDVPQQPFALNGELVALRHRVLHLESLVQSLPSITPNERITSASGVFSFDAAAITSFYQPYVDTGGNKEGSDEASVAAALQRLHNGSSMASTSGPRSGFIPTGNLELDSLLLLIPSKPICDLLVESFFTRVHWHIHVLHVPSFREELNKFWRLHAASSEAVSNTWLIRRLPTILIVLALGLHFMPVAASPFSSAEGLALLGKLAAATEKALILADWTGTPQARSVQAILLLSFYLHNTGFVHDDFDIPPQHMEFFQQELGARLWWWLCTYDWDVSFRVGKMAAVHSQDFSTATLLNLSDEDIQSGPMEGRGLTQPTIATFEILFSDLVFIAQQWSRPRKMALQKISPTIETLMGLDLLVRNIGGRLPDYLQFSKRNEKASVYIDASKPYIPLQRLCLNKEIFNRLTRIHRRRMFDDKNATLACREASAAILTLVQEFRARCDFAMKLWWINAYSIYACCLILVSNIFLQSFPLDPDTAVNLDLQRTAVQSSITDLRGNSSDPLSQHTIEGIRVLEVLSAEELAWHDRRSSSLAGHGVPQPAFNLERYSRTIDLLTSNTMCSGTKEALQLALLADSLLASSDQNLPPASSLASHPPAVLDPHLPLPFFGATGAGQGIGGEEAYDDFFRSLGFLPPVWGGSTAGADVGSGGSGGTGVGGSGGQEDEEMARWRGAFS